MPQLEYDPEGRVIYEPDGRCLVEYLTDRSDVSIIRGPVGSGTSSASCVKIWTLAQEQRVQVNGLRQSRWAIVRNTYPELTGTTLKTWLFWFPEHLYGRVNRSRPMTQIIRADDVELEVFFLALDGPEDVAKLQSFEFTGFWFNEMEHTNKEIFDMCGGRTRRYPPVATGGTNWSGLIADLNAPNEDHWLPMMAGEVPYPDDVPEDRRIKMPTDWFYKVQPAALTENIGPDGKHDGTYSVNPKAENQKWLDPDYYAKQWPGKSKAYIDSKLMNRITFFVEGDPVWPMFRAETHIAQRPLVPVQGHTVVVGLDFGRQPAAVIGQEINGRLYVQFEFRGYGVGSPTFAPDLKRFLKQHYPGFATFQFWGDPKGDDKGQQSESSSYDIFEGFGMKVEPAPGNNLLQPRLDAVEHILNGLHLGQPRFVLSPNCITLKAAMAGRYQLKRVGGEVVPVKDKYSHIADALQYLVLGLGEGRRMIGKDAHSRPQSRNAMAPRRSLRRAVA
jgi:hypothetical protein